MGRYFVRSLVLLFFVLLGMQACSFWQNNSLQKCIDSDTVYEKELKKAVMDNDYKLVRKMLVKSVDLKRVDSSGRTLLDHALELGHDKISWALIKRKAYIAHKGSSERIKELNRKKRKTYMGISIGVSVGVSIILSIATSSLFLLGGLFVPAAILAGDSEIL